MNSVIFNEEKLKAGTHNGVFHADDVFATAILRIIFGYFEVIRTRNSEILKNLSLIFDVGYEYDPEKGRFDHHQPGKAIRENEVPYAAFGLIWLTYGRQLLQDYISDELEIEKVWHDFDRYFVQEIDALDNGEKTSNSLEVASISSVISDFNPVFDSEELEDEAFERAVTFAGTILTNKMKRYAANFRAKSAVTENYNNRRTPELLILDEGCPWGDILQEIDVDKQVLFVVYPDQNQGFRIQVVAKEKGSYEARKDLPLAWAGKRDEELGYIIGINDAIFCHTGRFIAGAYSFLSILEMAKLALNE
jgi:uncharacterized UPF0160 family protein